MAELSSGVRVFGESNTLILPVSQPIALAQTRRSINTVNTELEASIDELGLLEAPRVALLGRSAFSSYLEFTQDKFGEAREIGDFRGNTFERKYPLVIDGHSRMSAMRGIAMRDGLAHKAMFVLSGAITPNEIVIEQLAANIQSRPSKEEEAPAIAGAYEFARYINEGMSMAEFCRTYGIKNDYLSDALHYVNLPDAIQDAVGYGGIPFGLAVEIAKRIELLTYYYEVNGSPDVEEDVRVELARLAMYYTRLKSVEKTITWIKGDSDALRQELLNGGHFDKRPDLFRNLPDKSPELVLFQETSIRAQQVRAELDQLIKEHRSVVSARSGRIALLIEEMGLVSVDAA